MDEKSIMLGRIDRAKVLIRRGSKPTQLQGSGLVLVIIDYSVLVFNSYDLSL